MKYSVTYIRDRVTMQANFDEKEAAIIFFEMLDEETHPRLVVFRFGEFDTATGYYNGTCAVIRSKEC